jgi:hypothetical protein
MSACIPPRSEWAKWLRRRGWTSWPWRSPEPTDLTEYELTEAFATAWRAEHAAPAPTPQKLVVITARYDGRCTWCGGDWQAGDSIARSGVTDDADLAWLHESCARAVHEADTP